MKYNVWSKIKTGCGKIRDNLGLIVIKHEKCIYTFLISLLLFLSVLAYQASQHSADLKQWSKEKALLEQDLKVATEIITLQGEALRQREEIIGSQGQMIIEQRKVLDRAKEIIYLQDKAIKDLLEKLQKWIPPTPVDPRKWAIYEAN